MFVASRFVPIVARSRGRHAVCQLLPAIVVPIRDQLRFSRTASHTRPKISKAQQTGIEKSSLIDQKSKPYNVTDDTDRDYEYFKQMTTFVCSLDEDGKSVVDAHLKLPDSRQTAEVTESISSGGSINLVAIESELAKELDLSLLNPVLPSKSFNLAAYVNESETLSNLVMLGVDLSKVEENAMVANRLVGMNFDLDVRPVLLFLHQIGVSDKDIGRCITSTSDILCEPLDNMRVRINYLESKKFSKEAVSRVISNQPSILIMSVKETDAQLGYLQKDFMLSGEEVREVVSKFPKIVVWNKNKIKDVKLKLKEFLGFSDLEVKQMLMVCPKLYTSDKHALAKRFDYVHNVIGYSHEDIVRWPQVLRTRTAIIRQRHLFLKLLRRDNFDSTRENYVSLKSIAAGRDAEFCEVVAKTSVQQFNDFLKTL